MAFGLLMQTLGLRYETYKVKSAVWKAASSTFLQEKANIVIQCQHDKDLANYRPKSFTWLNDPE